MQPLTLKLKNFGPYQDEIVDFSHFYESSLFLISGKTGSGKTTLFDGICYALYGVTSGGLRQGKEMRSNFAEATEPTKVTLTFKHQEFTYIIERQPEQILNKKRGDGQREQPAKAVLTVLDQAGKEVNQLTKQKEILLYVEELLHLNGQQFCQIVLLPQGEFRRFLNANSNEKELVLRKLFGTDIYRELANILKEKKKKFEQTLAQAEATIQLELKQLHWDVEYQEKVQEITAVGDILAELRLQQEAFGQRLEEGQAKLKGIRQEKWTLEKIFQEQNNLIAVFAEAQELKVEQQQLFEEGPAKDLEQVKLNQLLWAEKQGTIVQRLDENVENKQHLEGQQEELRQALEAIQKLIAENNSIQEKLNAQEPEMKLAQEKVNQMIQIGPLIAEKQENVFLLEGAKKNLLEEIKVNQKRTGKIQELKVTLAEQEATLSSRESLLVEENQLIQLQVKLGQLSNNGQEIVGEIQESVALEGSYLENQQQITQVENQVADLEKDYRLKKSRWAALQIARLSMDLVAGEACPVCGSLEHPKPHQEQAWTVAEIKEAEVAVEQAEVKATQGQKQLAGLNQKTSYLNQELQKSATSLELKKIEFQQTYMKISKENASIIELLPKAVAESFEADNWQEIVAVIEDEMAELTVKIEDLKAKVITLAQMKIQQDKLKLELHDLEEMQSTTSKIEQELNNEVLRLGTTVEHLQKQIPSEWAEVEDMTVEQEKFVRKITEWQTACQKIAKEIEENQRKQLVLQTNQQHCQEELLKVASGIEKVDQLIQEAIQKADYGIDLITLRAWLLEADCVTNLKESIKNYQQKTGKVQIQLESLEKKINQRELPDNTLISQKLSATEEQLTAQEKNILQVENQQQQNAKIQQKVRNQRENLAEQWQELGQINQLSEVANGDGPYNKMSIERFVLQTYLSEILRVANDRLMSLTQNRYSFELNQAQGSYKSQTGLEINIYDDNAGAVRSVNTLSGGESFIAALSLSLSLAEVVQNQTGGIQIDGMFIDEGFGSLDEDSLEMAMEALEMIEGQGRMIGIISHVKELKERIPQQLQVIAKGTGQSTIRYVMELE